MENAKITQEPLVKERFPSVVDTDDLIFELGKQTVKVLNLEKLLNNLLEKAKATDHMAASLSKTKAETTNQMASLQESNNLYEENNRKLDAEIVRLRAEATGLKVDLAQKDETIERLSQKRKPLKKKPLKG